MVWERAERQEVGRKRRKETENVKKTYRSVGD